MVVVIIIGILATGVVMMFTDPTGKVKTAVFEMRGDFNLARAAAVKENEDVVLQFLFNSAAGTAGAAGCNKDNVDNCYGSGNFHGTIICYDDGDFDCSNQAADDIVKTHIFSRQVKFYDFTAAVLPPDGPDNSPTGEALAGSNGITLTSTNDYLVMVPNGIITSDGATADAGSVVVYYPRKGSPGNIRGKPYAVVVASGSSGKIEIRRWREENSVGPPDERWSRK
jgi:Tfp pilus assembly protein FimT